MFRRTFLLMIASVLSGTTAEKGILFPQASETRETISLDGLWNFALAPISDPLVGFRQLWYRKNLLQSNTETILMPVPSSYNDITQSPEVRDHVGIVWYDRAFFVPKSWQNQRVWLRFSSVSYAAQVWVNGQLSMNHEIGHLPFQAEVTKLLNFGEENRVTVACDNTLLADTVPQGSIVELQTDNGTSYSQSYTFDFFNYAGIHRPVTLYTTPQAYIDDITISTEVVGTTGYVFYNISYVSPENSTLNCRVTLASKEGDVVASGSADSDTLTVEEARLWWPYLMDPNPGYLYTLKVLLASDDGTPLDVYRFKIGIRELAWTNTSYTINGKPIYFHGFGRHEDTDVRGKGLDFPTIVKDHNLIKWVGANAYRTSHYPYAEEIMDMADRLGIMIIDECPSVNTEFFSDALLEKHKNSLSELVKRDKNRPSVVAWSLANEPRTQYYDSGSYFGAVAAHVRSLDESRPLTIAIAQSVLVDRSAEHLDIIGFNRYNAWYANPGQLDMITSSVVEEATAWFEEHNKPVMMLEYGADTLEGLHIHPEFIWSEEYQVELMSKHFKAFDVLRKKGFFVGEFIWNFADFKTAQTYTRVGGNKKGVFTRNRQPKASAHHLRRRYFKLAEELYNASLPNDLYHYTASRYVARDEL